MNLQGYLEQKRLRAEAETQALARLRTMCPKCRKVPSTCYCEQIKPFVAGPKFVILIHPKENKKRIGTGRLTHLCIENSVLIEGVDFSENEEVQAILNNPHYWPVVLYPGKQAVDVSAASGTTQLEAQIPASKQLVVFVIDGSWFLAKKMLRVSKNLQALPQIKFTPPHQSIYQIRKQPKAICFSSIEAVHFITQCLQHSKRWPTPGNFHNLIDVFKYMIQQQLQFVSNLRRVAVRGNRAKYLNF